MTRAEYIEAIIKLFRAKYKPSEVELDEVKLALEMMPDRETLTWKQPDSIPPYMPASPQEFPPIVVMYGVQTPRTWWGDGLSTSTSTTTGEKKEE